MENKLSGYINIYRNSLGDLYLGGLCESLELAKQLGNGEEIDTIKFEWTKEKGSSVDRIPTQKKPVLYEDF